MTLGLLLRSVPAVSKSTAAEPTRVSRLFRYLLRTAQHHGHPVYEAYAATESLIDAILRYSSFDQHHVFAPPHLTARIAARLPRDPARLKVRSFYALLKRTDEGSAV